MFNLPGYSLQMCPFTELEGGKASLVNTTNCHFTTPQCLPLGASHLHVSALIYDIFMIMRVTILTASFSLDIRIGSRQAQMEADSDNHVTIKLEPVPDMVTMDPMPPKVCETCGKNQYCDNTGPARLTSVSRFLP